MGIIYRFFFSGACRLARLLLSLRYRVEVRGLETILPLKKSRVGILFLPNHPAEIDPVLLMTVLGPHFFPRSVIVEHFYRIKGFKKILDYGRVMPVPSMEETASRWKKKQIERTLLQITDLIEKQGENFLIYPSGKLKRSGLERVGGASLVHTLLQGHPHIPTVLVRTTGLWGSSFSVARTGKSPDFGKTFWQGCKTVLKNAIFFTPRRKVLIELEACPLFADTRSRLEFNQALELWYNRHPLVGEEPMTLVPYSHWSKEIVQEKVVADEQERKEVKISPKVEEEIVAYLASLAKMPKERIVQEADLAIDLGLDSLDIADVHGFLDKRYDAGYVSLSSLRVVRDLYIAVAEKEKRQAESRQDKEKKPLPKWFEKKKRPSLLFPEKETLIEAFLASCQRMGPHVACADDRAGVLSYRKMKMAMLLLAQEFARLPGDKVAVLLPSSSMTYITVLALWLVGKVPVMLNWTAGKKSLDHALEVGGFTTTITSKLFLDKIALEDLGEVEDTFLFLEDVREQLTWRKKLHALCRSLYSDAALFALFGSQPSAEKTAVLLFTSGSESMPKAVPLLHRHLVANQREVLALSGLSAEDSLLGVLPPFHSFGFSLTGILPLICGLKVFYAPDPTDSLSMASDTKRLKLSVLCLAPSFLRALFSTGELSQFGSVRLVVSGAEKAPKDLVSFVHHHLPQAHWIEGYGITECSPVVTLQRQGKGDVGVGMPMPGIDLAILVPETLEPVSPGGEGEIYIHGPSVFEGYLGENVVPPFLCKEGRQWYKSGDLGYLDEAGCLHITDRLKRTVKIGGEMLSLSSVEQSLEAIAKERGWVDRLTKTPSFALVVLKGEKPSLLLFTTLSLSVDEVNHALREAGQSRLVKVSRVVKIAEIPLMGTGKTHYRQLEEQLEALHV